MKKKRRLISALACLCGWLPLAPMTAVSFLSNTPSTSHIQHAKELQDKKKNSASSIFISDKSTSIDLLGYEIFTDPIAAEISRLSASDTPLTIGVFGEWGSGKTSFLKMICKSLKDNYNIESIVFNAWKYEKEENLWSALLQCILNHFKLNGSFYERVKIKLKLWIMTFSLGSGLSEIARSSIITISKIIILILMIFIIIVVLQPNISAYLAERNLTAGEVTLLGGGGLSVILLSLFSILIFLKAENIFNLLDKNLNIDFSKFSKNLSYQEHISLIDRLDLDFRNIIGLARGKEEPEKPIVIIIDDLDRCLPEKALQVIEGIKLFLDMEYCVYMFALDRDIIEKIVHIKYKDMNLTEIELKKLRSDYIEKLIQVSIPIPLVDEDRIKEYVRILYSKYDEIHGDYISDIFAQALPHNPRKIKHTIQRYLVWREIADTMINENVICPILLAKIVVIQDQFKELFNEIIQNNILLRALEMSSLGEDIKEGDDERTEYLSSVTTRAEDYLERYPQLRNLLSKVDKGSRFDKCDINSYIFLLRKLPAISEPISNVFHGVSAKLSLPLQKPPRISHFIDREDELASLLNYLQPGRVVTICGPGGIGKTALAAEAIWKLSLGNEPPERFPDGIIFHTFYQPEADLALEAIARAYGEDLLPSPREAAFRALAGRQALIVLDGTEACEDLQAILSVTTSCGVLITTRRHSDAPADWFDLTALPLEKAVQLLQTLAGKLASDKNICQEICNLLGCLPLATYLAGRYMAHTRLDARDYLAWLENTPLEALDLGTRQHQSISLLMEHSLEGVSEQGLACLGLTGVLAMKPFEPEIIAVALQITSQQANIGLGELVDYGLLTRPDARYRIAHALAHTYAKERLVVPKDALARLAGYYDSLSREQVKLGLAGYTKLDVYRDHILAVQSACNRAGLWSEVRAIAWALIDYLDLQGYWQERVALVQTGLDAACSDGSRYDQVSFLTFLGLAYADLGDLRKAIEFYEQALKISREIGDRRGEGNALGNLGLAYSDLGEPRKAIEFYEQALAIDREIGDRRGEGNALGNLGSAYAALGEPRKAVEYYEQALTIAREIGDRIIEGNALDNLGIAYKNLGEPRKAIEFYEQALAIDREIGYRRGEANALFNSSLAIFELGKHSEAIEKAEGALQIFEQIESPFVDRVKQKLAEWRK